MATVKLIALRRKDRKISQDDLAKSLGWSRETVAQLESGRQEIYLDQLKEIADLLGVKPEALAPLPQSIGTDSLRSLLPGDLPPSAVDLYRGMLNQQPPA